MAVELVMRAKFRSLWCCNHGASKLDLLSDWLRVASTAIVVVGSCCSAAARSKVHRGPLLIVSLHLGHIVSISIVIVICDHHSNPRTLGRCSVSYSHFLKLRDLCCSIVHAYLIALGLWSRMLRSYDWDVGSALMLSTVIAIYTFVSSFIPILVALMIVGHMRHYLIEWYQIVQLCPSSITVD